MITQQSDRNWFIASLNLQIQASQAHFVPVDSHGLYRSASYLQNASLFVLSLGAEP